MVIRDTHAPDFRRLSPAILNAIRIALSYVRAGGMPSSISKLLPPGEKLLGVEQISRIRLLSSRWCYLERGLTGQGMASRPSSEAPGLAGSISIRVVPSRGSSRSQQRRDPLRRF